MRPWGLPYVSDSVALNTQTRRGSSSNDGGEAVTDQVRPPGGNLTLTLTLTLTSSLNSSLNSSLTSSLNPNPNPNPNPGL